MPARPAHPVLTRRSYTLEFEVSDVSYSVVLNDKDSVFSCPSPKNPSSQHVIVSNFRMWIGVIISQKELADVKMSANYCVRIVPCVFHRLFRLWHSNQIVGSSMVFPSRTISRGSTSMGTGWCAGLWNRGYFSEPFLNHEVGMRTSTSSMIKDDFDNIPESITCANNPICRTSICRVDFWDTAFLAYMICSIRWRGKKISAQVPLPVRWVVLL